VRRPFLNTVLVATLVLPMLLGSLVLWSLSERVDRLDAVPAAVVNLDEPVETGRGKDRQVVAAGRLLAAGLTSPERSGGEQSLDWRLTSQDDAAEGLRDGDYYAVVTIPEDFSRTVSGLSSDDPERAQITVRSNDAASAVVGMVGDQIGEAATSRLNQRVTATFLEGLYARTGELKSSLGEAERGAGRVADGAARLGDGTAQLSDGAAELAGGLDSLAGGAGRITDGATRLSTGAGRMAEGTDRMRTGSADLADGADTLADGLGRLHRRTQPLPGQTRQLADGAGQVADGVDAWAEVLLAWRQACRSDPLVAGRHARLCAATIQAVGVDDGNADAMVSGSRRLARGSARLADATPALVDALDRSADGAQQVAGGAGRLEDGAGRLDRGASRLSSGAARLATGAERLAAGADRASGGAARLADGSLALEAGSTRLGDGSRELARGLGKGAEKIPDHSPARSSTIASTVAEPVVNESVRLNSAASTATALAPAVVALALWLGAFVTYLVRQAVPSAALARAGRPSRVALAGWLPAAVIGVVQSLLLLVALGFLDVVLVSPVGVGLVLLLSAAVFAALNQAFVAVLGRRQGWMLSIVVLVLQVVALGGLLPLETAPWPLQAVGGAMPLALSAEAIGALALGGDVGSVAGSATALVAWGAAALAATTAAARGRQRLTLSDVHRRVAAGHRT